VRAGRWAAVDGEPVAEEIEDLAKRNKRELESRFTEKFWSILLKLRLAKGMILEYNQRIRQASILRQRAETESLLRESPSLRRLIEGDPVDACCYYRRAAESVAAEYGVEAGRQPSAPSVGRICSSEQSAGVVTKLHNSSGNLLRKPLVEQLR
jgi:hypothetical protein